MCLLEQIKFIHGYCKTVLSPNHLQAAQIEMHTEVEEKQIIAGVVKTTYYTRS